MQRRGLMLAAVSVLWGWETTVSACPGCKDALEIPGGSMHLAQGYFWSIVTMLSVPVILVALITGLVVRSSRRARRHTDEPSP